MTTQIWYSVYVKWRNSKGEINHNFSHGYSEDTLKRTIAEPFNRGKQIFIVGTKISPSQIDGLHIFALTEWDANKIILPNGKKVLDEENLEYILKCYSERRVNSILGNATHKFIFPPEKESNEGGKSNLGNRNKIFIVHGRDEASALALQKYLRDKEHLDVEMFEDFKEKNTSYTII